MTPDPKMALSLFATRSFRTVRKAEAVSLDVLPVARFGEIHKTFKGNGIL